MTNEELEQEVKRLEEQITNLRIRILESKAEQKPYEVEVPEDIGDYYHISGNGFIDKLWLYNKDNQIEIFKCGLAFKTEEEAEKYDRERILLFKLHKWAEEHNEGWTPDWDDYEKGKFYLAYEYEELFVYTVYGYQEFLKLPYFKSKRIAEQFIEEFGDEIIEVFFNKKGIR